MRSLFPDIKVHYLTADFSKSLDIPPLDGIVMANALHYQKQKEPLLLSIKNLLKPGGRFVLVEYNVDRGNLWVPYPLSFQTWEALAQRCGFSNTRLLAKVSSRFLKEFYSALSLRPD
jgi:SAM-dependent methyltransferase